MVKEMAMEDMRGQPDAMPRTEEDGACGLDRNQIDIGSTTVERSVDGEWPRIHRCSGSDGFIQSGPNHRDMI